MMTIVALSFLLLNEMCYLTLILGMLQILLVVSIMIKKTMTIVIKIGKTNPPNSAFQTALFTFLRSVQPITDAYII